MIKKPTTLILGAGASVQYSYPLGEALTKQVISLLGNPNSIPAGILRDLDYSTDVMKQFQDALFFSGKSSVDAFLEHRDEFLGIGKAAIGCSLIPNEHMEQLFQVDKGWYQYLFGALNCKQSEFADNALSVVTFNYDRSLECYLHACLANTYGLSEERAAELLEHIPIIHVHGSLGGLPWQRGDAKARPYSAELTPESVAAGLHKGHPRGPVR
jgi:hypothetical protein